MKVYLDNAATTPLADEVLEAMVPVLKNSYGNPSSSHSFGREVRGLVEASRRSIAKLLNVSPGEIIFTSGGTEADNMAIKGAVYDLGAKHIVTTQLEHHAVLHTIEELAEKNNIQVHYLEVNEKGVFEMAQLEQILKENTNVFVSLMHGNNEIGNLIDLDAVGTLCRSYDAIFHSDTVQTMAHYVFDLEKTPVDFITGAAHKFHGPKGVGFLYVNKRLKIKPLMYGGSQERDMRAGTENVYGIVGLAKAMELCYEHQDEHFEHIMGLKKYMIEELKKALPAVGFNGNSDSEQDALYTVLSVSLPETEKGGMLLFNLDIKGIACSGGSACSSGSSIGSHVLSALKANPKRPAVRFSFSRYTQKEDIDYAVNVLAKIYE